MATADGYKGVETSLTTFQVLLRNLSVNILKTVAILLSYGPISKKLSIIVISLGCHCVFHISYIRSAAKFFPCLFQHLLALLTARLFFVARSLAYFKCLRLFTCMLNSYICR